MNKKAIRTIDLAYWSIIVLTTIILFVKQEVVNKFPILALENMNPIQGLVYSFFYAILLNWITTLMYIGVRTAIKGHYKKKLNIDDLKKNSKYYRDLIKKYSPAVLSYIDNFDINYSTVVATIMSLELKGAVDNNLNIKDKDVSKLDENEKYIFLNISNLKNIEINEFKKLIIEDGKKYKLIQDKKITKDEFEKGIKKLIIPVVIVVLGFILSILTNNDMIFPIAFLGGIIGYIITFFGKVTSKAMSEVDPYVRTKKAENLNGKLEGLKKYLQDYSSLKEKTADELVIWEDYLIYSVIFNQNEKIIKEYQEKIDRM